MSPAPSTKRDDFSVAASASHPVYSPSASSGAAGYSGSSGYGASGSGYSGTGSAGYGSSGSSGGYEAAASSTSYQSQASPNSNLYYYYYPVSKNNPQSGGGGAGSSGGSDADYQASAAQNYAGVSSPGGSYDQSGGGGSSSSGYGTGEGSSGSGYDGDSNAAAAYNAAAAASYQQQLHAYAAGQGGGSSYGPGQYAHLSQLAQQYGPQLAAAQQYAQYAQSGGAGHHYGGGGGGGGGPYASPAFQGNYDTSKRYYGLGSMIMPLLALAGLGLLIPTVTSLSGKKKRSVDDDRRAHLGDYAERLERYFKIYRAAVESEECMNRIICELGDAMSGVRGKSALLTVMEKFAPGWMTNKMGVFKSAALTAETSKCVRYKC
ncbi:glycine-rich protein, putative [Ixodes scapularis]|uniref:Glycine-rich protein, putative n=1 Tax=Ixodes scapularis TaxID=6945 RepID=B7PEH5_IXOSC|nr:glycine-rich protein, putative [Ixodes scapularis]|eukprot:XP_002433597.1 glycine-rich protein, putative [Ixodes scapularis]